MPKYEVPIVYKGQVNFIVAADSKEQADQIARDRFRNNDKADTLGNEWEEIDRVGEIEELGEG